MDSRSNASSHQKSALCLLLASLATGRMLLRAADLNLMIHLDTECSNSTTFPLGPVFRDAVNKTYSYPELKSTDCLQERRQFILHIGPAKTATTSLQVDLTRWQDFLQKDIYSFEGKFFDHVGNRLDTNDDSRSEVFKGIFDIECHKEVYATRTSLDANATTTPTCWTKFRNALSEKVGKNIIVSEEALHFRRFQRDGHELAVDWISLRDTLKELGWDLVVVFGYRRLYELLPSAKQERERWGPKKSFLDRWPQDGGMELKPLFPRVLGREFIQKKEGLPASYNLSSIPSDVEIRVLNLYDQLSVRSFFMCRILEDATESCRASLEADTAEPETRANQEQSLFFDALSTHAARKGLVDTKTWRRRDVAVAARGYHEEVLQRTLDDFPLICPSRLELEKLLSASLALEEAFMPSLDVERRDEHVQSFWAYAGRNKYCWIDAKATLEDPQWRTFFQDEFGPPTDVTSE